ncbi:hypothetical protein J3R83DRAFT_5227 [Lanmaoa asiatica]|nr:hypothetical protein J3R83DRAFT_5227 [Lanmaoa asiatica]
MPHEIHEALLTCLIQRLSSVVQGIPFGKINALKIQTLPNAQIIGDTIDAVPDLFVRMNYTRTIPHLVASHNCFVLDCAFSPSEADVMRKLKAYVMNFPNIVAVSKIVIKEAPYVAPNDHSKVTQDYQTTSIRAITVKDWMSCGSLCFCFCVYLRYGYVHVGWMATVWIYPPEILLLKLRAKGAALAAAVDFLGNFVVRFHVPPPLLDDRMVLIQSAWIASRPDHSARTTQHWIQDVYHLCGVCCLPDDRPLQPELV